jgi:hypothetical protein
VLLITIVELIQRREITKGRREVLPFEPLKELGLRGELVPFQNSRDVCFLSLIPFT